MPKQFKGLEEIAIEGLFDDIIATFQSNETGDSETNVEQSEKKIKLDTAEARLHSHAAAVEVVKLKIGDTLVSSYKSVRHKLWKLWLSKQRYFEEYPDVLSFIDCVFDDSFTKLHCDAFTFFHPIPQHQGKDYLIQLLKTLAKRSPHLQQLKIDWRVNRNVRMEFDRPSVTILAKSLIEFVNLSHLKINVTIRVKCNLFFIHLGKACPKLKILELGCLLEFGTLQKLALVLGEDVNVDVLPYSIKKKILEPDRRDSNLHCLQFANVSPICHSLERLISSAPDPDYDRKVDIQVTAVAFLLRHLPRLQELAVGKISIFDRIMTPASHASCHAIELLHDILLLPSVDVIGEGFVSSCLRWTIDSPPPRTFYLPAK